MELHEKYRLYVFYIIRNNIEGAEFQITGVVDKWTRESFVRYLLSRAASETCRVVSWLKPINDIYINYHIEPCLLIEETLVLFLRTFRFN
jgi:hypothetical protein